MSDTKNYFEKMKENFKKLPYEFNVTLLHFYMSNNKPCFDKNGNYDVRAKNSAGLKPETVYNVIKTIGPYNLNIEKFTNILIDFDEEDNTYIGELWIPTNLLQNLIDEDGEEYSKVLSKEDEIFLLENFSLKRTQRIKEDISNLENLL